MITIKKGWNISINDLLLAKEKGFPVFKTSHVGNLSVSSLYSHDLGFEDVIWDITQIDYLNSKPWLKLSSKSKPEILTELRPHFDHKKIACYGFTDEKKSIAYLHLKPVQNKNITSIATNILNHWDNIEKILRNCVDLDIQKKIFGLKVNLKGFLNRDFESLDYNQKINSFKKLLIEIKQLTLLGTEDNICGGHLVSFNCMTLLLYFCKYWETDKNTMFDLSGSRMINYLSGTNSNKNLNNLFSGLKNNCDLLPNSLEIIVVPTESFQLAKPNILNLSLYSIYKLTQKRRLDLSITNQYPFKYDNADTYPILEKIENEYKIYNQNLALSQHDVCNFTLEEELMTYDALKLQNLYLSIINSNNSHCKK